MWLRCLYMRQQPQWLHTNPARSRVEVLTPVLSESSPVTALNAACPLERPVCSKAASSARCLCTYIFLHWCWYPAQQLWYVLPVFVRAHQPQGSVLHLTLPLLHTCIMETHYSGPPTTEQSPPHCPMLMLLSWGVTAHE
jgi:hypothetical protein